MRLVEISRLLANVGELIRENTGDFSVVLADLPRGFVLGGGLCVGIHGRERATQDIDVFVPSQDALKQFIAEAVATGKFKRIRGHALEHRPTGIEVEVINPEFVKSLVIPQTFAFSDFTTRDGISVFTLRALIAVKLEAGRPRDLGDVADLIQINGQSDVTPYGPEIVQKYDGVVNSLTPKLQDNDPIT